MALASLQQDGVLFAAAMSPEVDAMLFLYTLHAMTDALLNKLKELDVKDQVGGSVIRGLARGVGEDGS